MESVLFAANERGNVMKINWKVRIKNKTWLMAFAGAVLAFVYQILGMMGMAPAVSEDSVVQVIGIAVNLLAALGVVQDPTTAGLGDSQQALEYPAPRKEA